MDLPVEMSRANAPSSAKQTLFASNDFNLCPLYAFDKAKVGFYEQFELTLLIALFSYILKTES